VQRAPTVSDSSGKHAWRNFCREPARSCLRCRARPGCLGQVRIIASQEFNRVLDRRRQTVYISMRCIEELENLDEVAAILAHEMSHVLLTPSHRGPSSQMSSIVVGPCTSWASTPRTC